jgi:phosphoribosyl-AMP cyclohydrolase
LPEITNEALDAVQWNSDGLVPAIAQDIATGNVLMVAWMNREALRQTISRQVAVYWSRSRKTIWHKGESSGHVQKIKSIKLDCDNDVILLEIEQIGGIACHTGRRSCFFQRLDNTGSWITTEPVLKDPSEIYGK